MTFAEYQSQVLEHYLEEQAAGKLFFASPYATPAKIKAGCLEVLEIRYDRRDERFLQSYFRMGNSLEFLPAVRKFDTDKFRPLNSYLRDSSRNPSPEHIELLAWLIDYPDRPYRSSYELTYDPLAKTNKSGVGNSATNRYQDDPSVRNAISPDSPIVPEDEKAAGQAAEPSVFGYRGATTERINNELNVTKSRTKNALYIVCAIVLSASIIYWKVNRATPMSQNGPVLPVIGEKGCVMWADNHYQPAPCKQSVQGIASFGLDVSTVKNLKRIISPDTITPKGLSKVWYVKIDGHLEYYTTAGFHPIHTELRLKPLTRYMYNKYLYHYAEKTK